MLIKWLTISGLVLQFIAFWLAAPELLGVDALKRFEGGLVKIISQLPGLLFGFLGFSLGLSLGVYGFFSGMQGERETVLLSMYITIGIMLAYALFMVFFYKRLQVYLQRKVAEPLIEKLINNNQTRKAALILGALFFTVGFLAQPVAVALS